MDPAPGPESVPIQAAGETPDRRAVILLRARDLFLLRGYAAISMQQIADAVGINKATLYHHFRDKDDLFTSVLGREMDLARDQLLAAVAEGGSLRAILTRVTRISLEMSGCDVPSLFMSLKYEVSPERRAAFLAEREFPWSVLRPVLTSAMATGTFRSHDPDALVELYFAMVRSQAPGPWRTGPIRDTTTSVDLIVSVFLDGVLTG